jgi:Fur family transcriptional regulator, ferric uptake regulator
MGIVLILMKGVYDAAVSPRRKSRTEWAEHALEELKREGHRSGGARAAVIELMARQECCVTAQEIFDGLRAERRDVGIASVYRTLDLLTRMGLVRRVELADAAGYEAAHPGGEHHHHLVCERCGKVSVFEDEELERAIERLEGRIAGRLEHTVGGHDVVLRGACADCRGLTADRPRRRG